jgi:hypothetical protein
MSIGMKVLIALCGTSDSSQPRHFLKAYERAEAFDCSITERIPESIIQVPALDDSETLSPEKAARLCGFELIRDGLRGMWR